MSQLAYNLVKWLPNKKLDIFGKDSLLMTSIPYYILALTMGAGLLLEDPNPFLFIAIIYAVFPLLDEMFSLDSRNPNNKERVQL